MSHSPRRLLLVGPLPPTLHERLSAQYDLTPLWEAPDRLASLQAWQGRFDGAVSMSRHGADEAVMACIRGTVLACFGVGYEHVDLTAAQRYDVQVSTTPGILDDCVADLAMALMLTVVRRVAAADRYVQAGQWQGGLFPLASRFSGKRLGIVGLGRIGQAIARRSVGFDLTVRYHGRTPKPDTTLAFEPDLLALARWADILALSCPGGPATHHLVSAAVLDALGPQGCLVNIARGSVVDEAALCDALADGRLGGAGLDVLADEPHVPDALLGRDNVVVLPHVAASTRETRSSMEQLVLDNLQAYFTHGSILTPPG